MLRPGEPINFLVLPRGSASHANWDALRSTLLSSLSVRYCYCSAFDSCWLAQDDYGTPRNLNPPQVAVCPRPKVGYSNRGD